MIQEISINNADQYYRLGAELNANFIKLFNINEIINNKYNKIYGYFVNDELLGFIHLLISFEEADIVNIIVKEEFRKEHIATKLIDYAVKKNNLNVLNNYVYTILEHIIRYFKEFATLLQ